jgi:lipoprotein signal peptidase
MEQPLPKLTPRAKRTKVISLLWLLLMVVGSIGLDQATKVHAQEQLMIWQDDGDPSQYQGRRYPVWATGTPFPDQGSFYLSFSFNYVRNLGAAWGALSGLDDSIRVPFFYAVTVLAVVIIGLYLRSTPVHHRLAIFALGLILSGAIGNFIDRFRLGYVIDWIDVRWNLFGWRYDFPNFNWADSAITVGVGMLIYDMIVLEHIRRKRETPRLQETRVATQA